MSRRSRRANIILLILLGDLVMGLWLVISNLFVDYQGLYRHISLSSVLDFETIETIVLIVLEIGLAVGFFLYFRNTKSHQTFRENVLKMIAEGENNNVEFKQTLRWDVKERKLNKALEGVILKTISGFLNADGGTVILGVTDKRKIVGIGKDYKTLPKKSCDGFENHLSQLLIENFGLKIRKKITIDFAEFYKNQICIVGVGKNNEPVYLKDGQDEYFFVRVGNGTRPLSISKATEYIKDHWPESR